MFIKFVIILLMNYSDYIFGFVTNISDLENDFNNIRDNAVETFEIAVDRFVPGFVSCDGGNIRYDIYENCTRWVEDHNDELKMPKVPMYKGGNSTDADLLALGKILHIYKEIFDAAFTHVKESYFYSCNIKQEANFICQFSCPKSVFGHWDFCCKLEKNIVPVIEETLVDLANYLNLNLTSQVIYTGFFGPSQSSIRKFYLGLIHNLSIIGRQGISLLQHMEKN